MYLLYAYWNFETWKETVKCNFFDKNDLNTEPLKQLAKMDMEDKMQVGIRPEHLRLCSKEKALLQAKIDVVEDLGEYKLLYFMTDHGKEFTVKASHIKQVEENTPYFFTTDSQYLHYFDKETGQALW